MPGTINGLKKSCRYGHTLGRSSRTGRCLGCQRNHNRKWAQENRATKNERSAAWNRGNRHKKRAWKIARKAGLRQAAPAWLTREQKDAIFAFYKAARDQDLTVDHIVPLKGANVCGLHVPWNLQLLTHSENSAKGNSWEGVDRVILS